MKLIDDILEAALEEFSRRERTRGSLPQDIAAQSF